MEASLVQEGKREVRQTLRLLESFTDWQKYRGPSTMPWTGRNLVRCVHTLLLAESSGAGAAGSGQLPPLAGQASGTQAADDYHGSQC